MPLDIGVPGIRSIVLWQLTTLPKCVEQIHKLNAILSEETVQCLLYVMNGIVIKGQWRLREDGQYHYTESNVRLFYQVLHINNTLKNTVPIFFVCVLMKIVAMKTTLDFIDFVQKKTSWFPEIFNF